MVKMEGIYASMIFSFLNFDLTSQMQRSTQWVEGSMDPKKLVEFINKRRERHAEIVKQTKVNKNAQNTNCHNCDTHQPVFVGSMGRLQPTPTLFFFLSCSSNIDNMSNCAIKPHLPPLRKILATSLLVFAPIIYWWESKLLFFHVNINNSKVWKLHATM